MKNIIVTWKDQNGKEHKTEYEQVTKIKRVKEEYEKYIRIYGNGYQATFFTWEIVEIEL